MMDISKISFDDIKFIDAGFVCSLDSTTQSLQILSPTLHLIGFLNMKKRRTQALCLEYRLVSEGFTQEDTVQNMTPLIVEYLDRDGNRESKNSAVLDKGKEYWNMFEQYKKAIEDSYFEQMDMDAEEEGDNLHRTIVALTETYRKRKKPSRNYVNLINTQYKHDENEVQEEEKVDLGMSLLFINTQLFHHSRGERQNQMGT